MDYQLNDIVEMKKQHPCKKSNQWKIVRMGADIKIKCLGCNAIVMFSRRDFEKRLWKTLVTARAHPTSFYIRYCRSWIILHGWRNWDRIKSSFCT